MISLSDRDLATVLAALRYWQRGLAMHQDDLIDGPIGPHFERHSPLSVVEIDDLCERLNTDRP